MTDDIQKNDGSVDIYLTELSGPPLGVLGLPDLPVRKLPVIMASGNKSEQERTPRDGCS